MVSSTKKKTGRPVSFHRDRHGTRHDGLKRLGDGRWRVFGPERYTFTEPNEDLAVARFLDWMAAKSGTASNLGKLVVHADANAAAWDLKDRAIAAGGSLDATIATIERLPKPDVTTERPKPIQRLGVTFEGIEQMPEQPGYAIADQTLSPQQWAWVGQQIIDRPLWVAQQCGVEQVGYLKTLKKPTTLPSLDELATIWEEKFNSSPEQKRKCPAAFKLFCKVTGVKVLDDITAEAVIIFRDAVWADGHTGKTQSNIFTRVRRYLSFFCERAIAVDEMKRLIGYLASLKPSESTVTLKPMPIEVEDWQKLLAAAKGADRAMVLVMLNAAMYLQEVVRVKWTEITKDSCLVTHRKKTGKCIRVAALWPETLKALGAIERKGDFIFNNNAGAPLGIKGAERRFRKLRAEAKVNVTSSQLRDGAYTAAVEANTTTELCQLLVGHRSGLKDHYVLRKPSMVAPACEAIRTAYKIGA